jgi:hypothetical protein
MRHLALLAAAMVCGVSCTPSTHPLANATRTDTAEPSAPTQPSKPRPSTAPARAVEGMSPALDARLSRALSYVSSIRGLPAKAKVEGRLIGRSEIARYISQQVDEENPKDVIEANEALLYGLGTVAASFDYRESVVALMSAQLLGFYDPKQKTFFVAGDLSGDDADATLWHELVHALQDQNYDLARLTDWQPDLGDSQAAIHALAEGDATSAMLDAMLQPRHTTALDLPDSLIKAETLLGEATISAPPVLVRSLIAPYVDGLGFTNALRREGGFPAVDAAWRDPPLTTEQLLHLEKYRAREAPLLVALPPGPPQAPELRERFHDVMGEQTLRIIFEEWMPSRTAASSASDWGGDRLAVFSDETRQRWAVGWHLRFDTAAAAERALLAFARGAAASERQSDSKLAPVTPSARPKGDRLCRERHTQGPFALVRRGADLGVTLGPFERHPVAVTPDLGCPAALRWVEAVINP